MNLMARNSFEEKINTFTHGIGFLLSVIGVFYLIYYASIHGNAWHIVSCSIYGTTLIALYLASTVYHGITNPQLKLIFKKVDHCSIYLLIAGSYTPFLLIVLKGVLGWSLFVIVWGIAIFGILQKVFFKHKNKSASLFLYLLMGWLCIIPIKQIIGNLSFEGVALLIAGGLFYTTGVIFYALDRPPYFHPIWHLFVMAGSICHFFSIIYYVVPIHI